MRLLAHIVLLNEAKKIGEVFVLPEQLDQWRSLGIILLRTGAILQNMTRYAS